jgi:hypothetical protein
MKSLWYFLVVALGAVGALGLFRVGERLVGGGGQGSIWVQLFIAVLCLLGAWRFLKKARAR